MSISTTIRSLIEQRALTATGFPTTQVAYEGVRFNPTPKTTWARIRIAPAGSEPYSLDAETHEHVGVVQIDVFLESGRGMGAAELLSDAVRAVFRPGTRLGSGADTIIIDSASRAAAVLQDPDWVQIPVQVRWRSYSVSN